MGIIIGMHHIFVGSYSPHNPIMTQIKHWDCADYDPSPIESTYEYDAENLPIKMTNSYNTVLFFYE